MEDILVYRYAGHLSSLEDMRSRGVLCDVTIQVEHKEFQAHKFILAAASTYFEIMFTKFEERNKKTIPFKDVSARNMEAILSFVYTGQITFTEENAMSLAKLADYLGFVNIKEEGIRFIKSRIQARNAYKVYRLAVDLASTSLSENSVNYMQNHFGVIWQTDDYLDFNVDLLSDILSDIYEDASPKIIFKAVMRWILNDVEKREMYMPQLLGPIKISGLNSDFLVNYFFNDGPTSIGSQHCKLATDVMSFYKEQSSRKSEKYIVAVDSDRPSNIEMYNFVSGTWDFITTNQNINVFSTACMHEDKLYTFTNFGVHVYEPQNQIWRRLSPAKYSLSHCGAVALNGFLYVCGGLINVVSSSNWVARYCPESDQWYSPNHMRCNRASHAVVAFQNCIYAIGGYHSSKGAPLRYSNMVERYDPDSDQWTVLDCRMNEERANCGAAELNGMVYVCGGFNGNQVLSSVEVYNPKTKKWKYVKSMGTPREGLLLVANMGKLWAVGGCSANRKALSTVEVYDPDSDEWYYEQSMNKISGEIRGGIVTSS